MDNNSIIYELINIYKESIVENSISFNGSEFVFQLQLKQYEENKIILLEIFDTITFLPDNKVSLKFSNLKIKDFLTFYKKENFLKNTNYLDDFDSKTILILDEEILLKLPNEEFSKEKALIFNNYAYQNILLLLKKNQFFSSLKSHNNEFVLVSKENSVIYIGYKNIEPKLEELDNIYPQFELLKKRFEKVDLNDEKSENVEFIKLFIENISTAGFGNNKEKKEDSLFEIVKGLKILISLTERDYENYIKNFSFEKIKSKFKDERNKYFEGLEKNIELISKQVVSFPLTFAATAFASYQVKEKPLILILIFIAYSLYTIIAFKILKITSYNVECLEHDINKEEDSIKKNYNKVYEEFEKDFEKINKKKEKIKNLLHWLKIILRSMLFLFSLYIFYQSFFSKNINKIENIIIPIDKIRFIQIDSISSETNSNKSSLNQTTANPVIDSSTVDTIPLMELKDSVK